MINIMKMRLFPLFSKTISIPTNESKPYNIIFMSENSNFFQSYSKLNIRRQFAKRVTYPSSKIPRLISNIKNLIPYRSSLGLLPITKPDANNTYIDTTPFFQSLDLRFGKQSYKRSIVFQKIIDYFNIIRNFGDSKNILIYHVNMSKPVAPQFLFRRSAILALMAQAGDGTFPFDCVVLAIERNGVVKYSSIYNKDQKSIGFPRILSLLKRLVPKEQDLKASDESDIRMESLKILEDESEKESILRFIDKHQKRKVITS